VIKFIFKWFGFAKKAFSVYRILFIVGGVVIGFVVIQQIRIKSKTKTIASQKATIKTLEFNNEQITLYNEIEHANTLKCLSDYSTLSGALISAEGKNEQAVQNIEQQQAKHDENIKLLKAKIQPVTICDDAFIDDDFSDLMREKVPNIQD
jgi:hypothetical protein